MRSTGHVDKLNPGSLRIRSATISVVAELRVICWSSGVTRHRRRIPANCVRRPSSRASRIRKRARARFSPRPQR